MIEEHASGYFSKDIGSEICSLKERVRTLEGFNTEKSEKIAELWRQISALKESIVTLAAVTANEAVYELVKQKINI